MTDIDNEFKIKVKCKYSEKKCNSSIDSGGNLLCCIFSYNLEKGYVRCIGNSYVDWVFFLKNKNNLIEVK